VCVRSSEININHKKRATGAKLMDVNVVIAIIQGNEEDLLAWEAFINGFIKIDIKILYPSKNYE
jgi:hypothetical protein